MFSMPYNKVEVVAVRECMGTSGDKLDPRCRGSLNCTPGVWWLREEWEPDLTWKMKLLLRGRY